MRPSNPPLSLHNGRFGTYPSPLLLALIDRSRYINSRRINITVKKSVWRRLQELLPGAKS